MELFELKREISSTEADIEYFEEEKERIYTKLLPKASDPSKELVKSGLDINKVDQISKKEMEYIVGDRPKKKLRIRKGCR